MVFLIFTVIFTLFVINFIKNVDFFTLLLIKIEIKSHIKTLISPTCYSINSSNY